MDQLSSLIVHYLCQALSTIFEGDFSEKNLSLEISSGSFSLENVKLKEQLFSDLPVSMMLSHGSIGKLDISIPWKNLGTAPLLVSVDKVDILLQPCFLKDTKSSAARKSHQMKLAKLSSVDSLCGLRGSTSSHSGTASFLFHYLKEKVARIIFGTLEISVQNVHIRFEDQVSCSDDMSGFAVGVTLDSLLLRPAAPSVDGDDDDSRACGLGEGVEGSMFCDADTLQQLFLLRGLAVYCNPLSGASKNMCCAPYIGRSGEEIADMMQRTIARQRRISCLPPAHAYILRPLDFSIRCGVNFSTIGGNVHIALELVSPDVTCEIEDMQLKCLSSFAQFTEVYLAANQFSQFRPDREPVGGRRDPAAWWRFAIRAVRCQLGHYSRLRLCPEAVDRSFKDKLVYTGEIISMPLK